MIKKISKLKNVFKNYFFNNIKEYILVILLFLIGLFIGVMAVNNVQKEKLDILIEYINGFLQKFYILENIEYFDLILDSIKSNLILAVSIWFAGTTIIGLPIVFGIIIFRGFCLGYTISTVVITLGIKRGILFCITTLFLQNIFFIPAITTIGVSSIKLYKSIINDRRKENIKIEIIRHTIISFIMLAILIISSIIENTITIKLLKYTIKWFI